MLSDPVLLAPMAGITDAPFRQMVGRFGAGLVVSEMIASREMVTARAATRAKASVGAAAVPEAVQIAGCEAHWMAEAARIVADQGAPIVDINMGCPAKKVTSGWSGSALMRAPDHALRLIEAVVAAVNVPVTLKMRLGWDASSLNAPEIARRAEAAGIAMVTVHGRTRAQFYKGQADWPAIAAVVEAVSIPVVANGDIVDAASARAALAASGAAAVMIGRGAQGAPWRPAEIAAALAGRPAPAVPTGEALADLVLDHYDAILAFYGAELGSRIARKHLSWYLTERPGGRALRAAVIAEPEAAKVRATLAAGLRDLGAPEPLRDAA